MVNYNIFGNCDLLKEDETTYKNYLQMDKIMKKLFSIKNPRPIIDFLNSIYGDDISYNAEIKHSDKEIINKQYNTTKLISFYADMYITVIDNSKVYEYAIEFQTMFEKEIAIRIFRYSFERAVKIADYSKAKEIIKLKMPEPYIVILEEEPGLGDKIILEIEFGKKEKFSYDVKVLKYWNYDLERLYKENMYLLYPLQIFKLRKKMNKIYNYQKSEILKKQEMFILYDELKILIEKTLNAIDKAYEDDKIEITDYNEMNIVLENLNSYFLNMYGKYGDFEGEMNDMVKTFYDPRVEERGKIKGRLEGKLEEKKLVARNMLLEGESNEKIKRYTELSDEEIASVRKLIEINGKN